MKTGIERLEPYKNQYDFTLQLMDGEYNVFVERDLVELYAIGGYKTADEAIDGVIKWIKRVNKEKQ